jgi:hypothetical protein
MEDEATPCSSNLLPTNSGEQSMKSIYTLAAMLLMTVATPAFAQEAWDMPQPSINKGMQQVEAMQMEMAKNVNGNIQWDTTDINANNAAAYQAYMAQVAQQQAQQANHTMGLTSAPTGNQRISSLPVCQTAIMSGTGSSLPATTLDSFVADAGGNAENIYGDEGTTDIPPLFGFSYGNSIQSGMPAMTTGHDIGLPMD